MALTTLGGGKAAGNPSSPSGGEPLRGAKTCMARSKLPSIKHSNLGACLRNAAHHHHPLREETCVKLADDLIGTARFGKQYQNHPAKEETYGLRQSCDSD